MPTIRLKERCSSCDGRGYYPFNTPNPPCFICKGKGWVYTDMRAPDPKWAREYRKQAKAVTS